MLDPLRGEMTARYVLGEDLEWAARERLLRQANPAVGAKRIHRSGVEAWLGTLANRFYRLPSLALHRVA